MTNEQEPEHLSCEWHARMHDVAANAAIELMRSAPDTASVRDFHAEADSHRDSAAKLRSIPGLEAELRLLQDYSRVVGDSARTKGAELAKLRSAEGAVNDWFEKFADERLRASRQHKRIAELEAELTKCREMMAEASEKGVHCPWCYELRSADHADDCPYLTLTKEARDE